jgi:hypothetical protein
MVRTVVGWLSAHRLSALIMVAAAIGFAVLGPLVSSSHVGHGAPIDRDPQTLVLRSSDLGADFTPNTSKSGPGWPPCGHQHDILKDRVASSGTTFTARDGNGFVRSLAYEYVNQDAATSAFTSISREITGGFDVGLCLAESDIQAYR